MDQEERAKITMNLLEKYADNNLLSVNVQKTKSLLAHNVVVPSLPKLNKK